MSKMATVGSTRQWIKFNYSTNTYFHKYMKIGVGPAILELFNFLESKIDLDYTPKFLPIWKKVN